MNSRHILESLLQKYSKEKWVLSPKAIMAVHDSMSTFNKKFHAPAVEEKLKHSKNNIWFGLRSGIIFDRHEFLMIGDSLDEFHFNYELDGSLRNHFLSFEGHTMYYKNGDSVRKMTLSIQEMSFFKKYINGCDDYFETVLWDWEEITDL